MPPDHATRFAPSPTGLLHLGHAFSALTAAARAAERGGRFLLRIEDTDSARCRPEFEQAIWRDLRWLGLDWPEPVLRQSDHLPRYRAALDRLAAMGIVYACRCSRGDIRAALAAPQEGVGAEPIYPGTCRSLGLAPGEGAALRLNLRRALARVEGRPLAFEDTGPEHGGRYALDPGALLAGMGDIVLARRDGAIAYHLAVVLDDALQGITEVVRGADLFQATALHRLLQEILGLPVPVWHHHRLIRDAAGKRLAKRDDARSIARFREDGASPGDIRRMLGL
jgi:glutamyl-Q tRNA(Asp) synthetase